KGIRVYKFNIDYVVSIKWVVELPFNARLLSCTSISFSHLVNLLEVKHFILTFVKEIDIVQLGIVNQAGLKLLLRSSSVSAPPHKPKAQELNPTLNKSLPELNSPPSVKDDRINEARVLDPVRSRSLDANASEPSYPKSVKEARGHLIE
ncbi:hypothetical protein Tco_1074969, partial [Tanacetum coccineum]